MHQYATGTGQPAGAAFGQIQSLTSGLGRDAPVQPNALEQHEHSLSALVGHLSNLNQRALNLSDRMFGSQPEPVSKGENPPANPPAIRRLEDLMAMAHQQIDALTRHIERLERL